MYRSMIHLAVAGAMLAGIADAHADDAVTSNVALTSDYLFRGISQTWGEPAIQGGVDATWDNGFAAGAWTSSISRKSYPGAAAELDLYASYGASFATDWSWRAGLYGYVYPGGNLDASRPALASRAFDTLEANATLTWKTLSLKMSRSLGDYFAIDREQGYRGDSHGTTYVQLDDAIALDEAWSLALHAGHTHVTTSLLVPLPGGARDPSYTDVGATLKWQFAPHWSASAGVSHTGNGDLYAHTVSFRDPGDVADLGGTRGFVMLQGNY